MLLVEIIKTLVSLVVVCGGLYFVIISGDKVGRKDVMLTAVLSLLGIGLGQIYVGDKRKGFIIMITQVALAILAGPAMFVGKTLPVIMYIFIFGIGVWAIYDAISTAKLVNEYLEQR